MASISNPEKLARQYQPYVVDLREFFTSRGLAFGAPENVTGLAERLDVDAAFADELFSMLRSFNFREQLRLSRAELLEIISVAVGGPEIDQFAQTYHASIRRIFDFLNNVLRVPINTPGHRAERIEEAVAPAEERPSAPAAEAGPPLSDDFAAQPLRPRLVSRTGPLATVATDVPTGRGAREPQPSTPPLVWLLAGFVALSAILAFAFVNHRREVANERTTSTTSGSPAEATATPQPAPNPSAAKPSPDIAAPATPPAPAPAPGAPPAARTHPSPRPVPGTNPAQPRLPQPAAVAPTDPAAAHRTEGPAPIVRVSRVPPGASGAPAGRPGTLGASASTTDAHLLAAPQPEYPALARLAHIQGTVTLQAVIARDGSVSVAKVLDGHHLLRSAAINAVRHWRYRPFYSDGHPVDVSTVIQVNFHLPE